MSWYREGVISLTNGSKTVIGTGTAWLENVVESSGLKTPIGPEEIESVTSNTVLQLVMPYDGPTISAVAYSIIPTQGLMPALTRRVVALISASGAVKDAYAAGNLAKTTDMEKRATLLQLAATGGSSLMGYDGGTLQDIADQAKTLQDYAALRAYGGRAKSVRFTSSGITGPYDLDAGDTTSVDTGGTCVVDVLNRRWKRRFDGPVFPRWFEVSSSSTADQTVKMQAAIDAAIALRRPLRIEAGTYMVKATGNHALGYIDGGLRIGGPLIMELDAGAVLKAIPGGKNGYAVLNIQAADSVTVSGGKILGERYQHAGTTGEHGFGVMVLTSSNVMIRDMEVSECWGDGICLRAEVAGAVDNTDVRIVNVRSRRNRRQGLTIGNGRRVYVSKSEFSDTSGTAPQAGIDIEPNPGFSKVRDVVIEGNTFSGNGSYDLVFGGGAGCENVTVTNNLFSGLVICNATSLGLTSKVVISKNVASAAATGNVGIGLKNVKGVVVSGNAFAKDSTVIDSSATGYGVYMEGDNQNITIEGNTVTGMGYGCVFASITSKNVSIRGNDFATCYRGVFVTTSTEDAYITGNSFQSIGDVAVFARMKNGSVSRNTFKDVGNTAITTGNSESMLVEGNRFMDIGTVDQVSRPIIDAFGAQNCFFNANQFLSPNANQIAIRSSAAPTYANIITNNVARYRANPFQVHASNIVANNQTL